MTGTMDAIKIINWICGATNDELLSAFGTSDISEIFDLRSADDIVEAIEEQIRINAL